MRKKPGALPLVEALSWIVLSLLLTAVLFHRVIRPRVFLSGKESAKIDSLIQTGPQKEALRSEYLMELLGLSKDRPLPLVRLSTEQAKQKLLSSPVIAKAFVKKVPPSSLYVDYTVRKPCVWAANFCNAALDREGVLFPMHPFFSPKKLTEVYFKEERGASPIGFGSQIQGADVELAFALLDFLQEVGRDLFFVRRIDVSKAYAPSLGKREIIVILDNEVYVNGEAKPFIATHFLRLSQKQYKQEIQNYLELRKTLLDSEGEIQRLAKGSTVREQVIDLRISQLAFVQLDKP